MKILKKVPATCRIRYGVPVFSENDTNTKRTFIDGSIICLQFQAGDEVSTYLDSLFGHLDAEENNGGERTRLPSLKSNFLKIDVTFKDHK